MRVRSAPASDDKTGFVTNPGTTPEIYAMDPRADPDFNAAPADDGAAEDVEGTDRPAN